MKFKFFLFSVFLFYGFISFRIFCIFQLKHSMVLEYLEGFEGESESWILSTDLLLCSNSFKSSHGGWGVVKEVIRMVEEEGLIGLFVGHYFLSSFHRPEMCKLQKKIFLYAETFYCRVLNFLHLTFGHT